jgi:hypothetical protein
VRKAIITAHNLVSLGLTDSRSTKDIAVEEGNAVVSLLESSHCKGTFDPRLRRRVVMLPVVTLTGHGSVEWDHRLSDLQASNGN